MNMVQRGNPSILSKIREGAKSVSEAKGLDKPLFGSQQPVKDTSKIPNNINEMFGGTNQNLVSGSVSVAKPVKKIDYESTMINRVLNNLDTLKDTKEYFNAIQDLMALYVSGDLDDSVMSRLSREDIREIKSILDEFKSILDNY